MAEVAELLGDSSPDAMLMAVIVALAFVKEGRRLDGPKDAIILMDLARQMAALEKELA